MYARNTSTAQYGPSGVFASARRDQLLQSAADRVGTGDHVHAGAYRRQPGRLRWHRQPHRAVPRTAQRRERRRLDNYDVEFDPRGHRRQGRASTMPGPTTSTASSASPILPTSRAAILGTQQINNALDVIAESGSRRRQRASRSCRVCARHGGGIDPTCVPWNIWQKGGVTPARWPT